MSLIKYHILNLPFREDRKYAQLGAFAVMEYPRGDIIFHEAPSGYEYENTEAVCQAAADDGFPVFLPCLDKRMKMKNGFAYMWGTLQIMREIANGRIPYGYYNQDDNFLTVGPNQIHQDIDELENLKIAQLYWHGKEGNPSNKKTVRGTYYEGSHVSGDSGLILSKEGAQLFIDTFQKEIVWMERLVFDISQKNKSGIYCIVDESSRIIRVNHEWLKYKDDGYASENQGISPILANNNT